MWLTMLRRHVSCGRMALALVSLITVTLLSGCWAVAGPLIGVGVVGGGVGVAAATRGPHKAPPDPDPVQESSSIQESSTSIEESVPQSASSQLTEDGSPVIASAPSSSPAAVPSPASTVSEAPRKQRSHRRKAKAVARSSKPEGVKNPSPSVASSALMAPPDTLPNTVIVH